MSKPVHRKNGMTGSILCKKTPPKKEVRWSKYGLVTCPKCLKIEGGK